MVDHCSEVDRSLRYLCRLKEGDAIRVSADPQGTISFLHGEATPQ